MKIQLSYILTTYNKLPYLKTTLPYLISACKADEEIVIVDGGSSDGTADYLKELLQQQKIHQFISEKDSGEAHGTNKAILLAKGELLKIITDDDVFDFDVINSCKLHLLENKEIDICGTDGLGISSASTSTDMLITNYGEGFTEWKQTKKPFLFCGLSFMIRRSSISKLGLLSTQFKIIDIEYSVRVSSLNAIIAFCNAYSFVNIVGSDSNSNKFYGNIRSEKSTLKKLYPTISNLNNPNNLSIVFKEKIKKIIHSDASSKQALTDYANYVKMVEHSLTELKTKNKTISTSFL